MKKSSTTLLLAASAFLLHACSDDGATTKDGTTVRSTFQNLDVLGEDYVYEGWLITPNGPVSAGRFESEGTTTTFDFAVDSEIASVTSSYVLTIEPAQDDDPAPAATHVLAGDIVSRAATLSISHGAALGQDFSGATGVFGMAVPSDHTGTGTFRNGIWWLQQPGPTAGLTLPILPEGWAYEGWVASAEGPISTGVFTAVDVADSDSAGATGGTNASPGFPGQDFVLPQPVDLVGMAAVISVEPQPDNSPAPFGIKPLIDSEIQNVGPLPATQPMALVISENQPSGNVTIK